MPERLHVSKYNQKEVFFFFSPTERSCDVTDSTPWSFNLSKSIQYITSMPNGNPTGIYCVLINDHVFAGEIIASLTLAPKSLHQRTCDTLCSKAEITPLT